MNTDIILRLLSWARGTERSGSVGLATVLREAAFEIEKLQRETSVLKNKCEILESDVEALQNKKGLRAAFLEKERDEARRLYCSAVEEIEWGITNETKYMCAKALGWDCFDNYVEPNTPNDSDSEF